MLSKAIKAPKGGSKSVTTGKMKASLKANKYKSVGTGAVNLSPKTGTIREYMSGAKVKGTARKVRDNAQRTELEAKGYSKRASVLKYPSNKLFKSYEKQANPKPKVPVKKKSK
jgi:hypothetical protein